MRFIRAALLLGASWLSLAQAQSTNQTESPNNNKNNTTTTGAALFITPTNDLAFALTVPSSSDDLFFSITLATGVTWAAIGLGSATMANALTLILYPSSSGQNLTLSPRLATGHSEPAYAPSVRVDTLPGTGLSANNDSRYVFNGRCANCRSWSTGKVDVGSAAQPFLYATGPDGSMWSDDPEAPLKMHLTYGTFTMDMLRATTSGAGSAPSIAITSGTTSFGTTLGSSAAGKQDIAAIMHAIIMIFVFFALLPFGIFIVRIGGWVKWHAVNQGLALLGAVTGAALGIYISYSYNRSKKFNNPHQIIGLIVFILIISQFVLGIMHHMMFKKTDGKSTKLAPFHVWLGRLTILLGVINAFLGFPLAQSPAYNYILAGLALFIFPVLFLVILTKSFVLKMWRRNMETSDHEQGGGGYDLEPWRAGDAQAQPQHPYGAPPATQVSMVGLSGVGNHVEVSSMEKKKRGKKGALGPQQTVQEYV